MRKFTNVRLRGTEGKQELLVENGIFTEIAPFIPVECETIDLGGKLTLPPFVDPHIHLDYVFSGRKEGAENSSGTLFEGIERWSEAKKNMTVEEIKSRARLGVKKEMLHGVQMIRTHVDVTDPRMTSLKALLELKEELKGMVDLQIVSFPQEGMYFYRNGAELVEEGLRMGADCVGGIPHFELSRELGEKSVHKAVELALKYDRMIDIHCDETDDPQSRFLELLTALAFVEGIGERTTASHTCSFGSADNCYAFRMMKNLKIAKLNMIACPTENVYLEGRQDTYPKRRGLTRVKELYESGINICFAQDSIQDPWYPLGNGNLMKILDNGIHLAQMMSAEEIDHVLELITCNGARTMQLQDSYGIEVGKPANFIVLDAENEFEAVSECADVTASVRGGKFLFRKAPVKYEEIDSFFV